ncbi:unnamed protein product [Orchesella dallaii]|uniref:Annexin n=1 Tax=Orchesella dallaii TaxID=48710 RepID=A0ABP1R0I3_9HEXA
MDFYLNEPSVRPDPSFNALEDAKALRAAMKGFGTDEAAIIAVLTKKAHFQRQEIITAFKNEFGRDLIKDLKSELGGKFEKLVLALMETPYDYLAHELESAMAGLGTNEDVLTEVLCTRSNQDIRLICEAYQNKFGNSLEDSIKDEVSGEYKRLLVMLLNGARDDTSGVNLEKAKEQAEKLYAAGEGCWGTDEETFVVLLAHESFQQLRIVFDEYRKVSGKTIEQAIKSEFSGDLLTAIETIVRCVLNRNRYYAEKLEAAMKGFGTDDSTLIRIIVSRSEIDLGSIKKEYQDLYRKTLHDAVKKETGGDYKVALLALIGDA